MRCRYGGTSLNKLVGGWWQVDLEMLLPLSCGRGDGKVGKEEFAPEFLDVGALGMLGYTQWCVT